MRITVRAKPNARSASIEQTSENEFVVCVTEPPVEGRANRAIIRLVADYFGVSPNAVSIVSGAKQKLKIIEVKK